MGKVTAFFRNNIRQYGMVLALVFIMALFQVLTGGILFRPMNITNLVLQNSYVLILGVGMLLCIVTGNVDLSVGSVVAFVGAVAAVFMIDMHMPVLPGIILTLLVGLAVGAFHGYFIAYKKVPPFIVTLAGMLIFRGLTMVILRGQTKAPFDKSIQNIAAGYLPGDLNIAGFNAIAIACGLVLSAVFIAVQMNMRKRKRKYDFEVLPIGLEIVKIALVVVAINTLTLLLAAHNGIPLVLILLASLIFIYTFITQKTIAGGLVMGVLNNGMSIMGVSVDWQQAIKGMVLLAAVCFDVYTKSKNTSR